MKQYLPLFLILLTSPAVSQSLKGSRAEKTAEKVLQAIGTSNYKNFSSYFVKDFFLKTTESEAINMFKKVDSVLGPIKRFKLMDNIQKNAGKESFIALKYVAQHDTFQSFHRFIVILEDGKHKILRHAINQTADSSLSMPLRKSAALCIEQDGIKYPINENGQVVVLKSKPFQLQFKCSNTDWVSLHASSEPSSYLKAKTKDWNGLECFGPGQAYSIGQGSDSMITLAPEPRGGFEALMRSYGIPHLPGRKFTSFEKIDELNSTDWIGTISVWGLDVLDISLDVEKTVRTTDFKGRIIYLIYSPNIEKQGWGVKLQFE